MAPGGLWYLQFIHRSSTHCAAAPASELLHFVVPSSLPSFLILLCSSYRVFDPLHIFVIPIFHFNVIGITQYYFPVTIPIIHRLSHRKLTEQCIHRLLLELNKFGLLKIHMGVLLVNITVGWIYGLSCSNEGSEEQTKP